MQLRNKLLGIYQKIHDLFIYLFTANLNEKKYLKRKFSSFQNLVVLDVGANVGIFSKKIQGYNIAKIVNFHLFEPNNDLINNLKLKFSNHKINEVAISEKNSSAILYVNNISSQSSLLESNSFLGEEVKKLKVRTLRLDSYIESEGIDIIHLLKIDVEGHELTSLISLGKYLNSHNVKIIKIEISFVNGDNLGSINSLLNKNGFYLDGFTNTKYLGEKILFLDAYYSPKDIDLLA